VLDRYSKRQQTKALDRILDDINPATATPQNATAAPQGWDTIEPTPEPAHTTDDDITAERWDGLS